MVCAEGYYSTGGSTQCIACSCEAGASCTHGQSTCGACPAGETSAGGSDRLPHGVAKPRNYLALVVDLEGLHGQHLQRTWSPRRSPTVYASSSRSAREANALSNEDGGSSSRSEAAPVAGSGTAVSDEISFEIRAVETTDELARRFEKFLVMYKANHTESNSNANTNSSTVVEDASSTTLFVETLRANGMSRIRSAQIQEVGAWQNGEEVAHVGESQSVAKLSPFASRSSSAARCSWSPCSLSRCRVAAKRHNAGRGPRNLESGIVRSVSQRVEVPRRPFNHSTV
ncbi:hypothetical protein PINS_up023107 [Pythium insidiosum]|nr:hypothetical protein PINS_up023107 [Pythium insidiosum]